MATFATIFLNNILPAFLIIGAGVLMDRLLHVEHKSLSRMALYVLSPCLLFSLIINSTVDPARFAQMLLFSLVTTLAMIGIALLVGWALRWPSRKVDGLVLATAFVNSGNFGLSVILFSYGEEGLALASAFFVISSLAAHTLGAFFAARGDGGMRVALGRMARLPGMYAFLLAFGLRLLGVRVPDMMLEPITLVGRAAVPILLLLLGLQLSQTHVGKHYKDVALGVLLRLVVGAGSAVALAPLVGLQGLARQVGIVEAATPTAVSSSLMAIEFGADPEYVTSVIFFSTLLSAVTLTILIGLL